MDEAISLLKKVSKVILWVFIGFVLLFTVIAVLIQIPAIQNKIVTYATSYVSKKTHTKVEIKNIAISFPKSIVIEGLFLEDLKKDTLIYAEEVRVNIAILNLLNYEIKINYFALEDVSLNINRIKTDSLFNYDFLLTAFSDTSKQKVSEPTTKSNWTFSLDNVSLKNIKLNYKDNYGGMIVDAKLKELDLKMDKIDMENSIYTIDDLLIESLTANVLVKPGKTNDTESESILPKITANKLEFNNINLSYENALGNQSIKTSFNQLQVKKTSIDLQKQMVSLDKISLSKSKINYNKTDDFSITKFETDFFMNQHSITTKNLKVKTENSFIDADLNMQYSSLTAVMDSLQYTIVNADLKNASINNSDILYFYPPLINQSFFKNALNNTTISGLINGPINNLKGKNLIIKTGINTALKSDFVIIGLPNIETAHYNFPNLKIYSGRKDIAMMVGTLIPSSIELPEKINI